MESINVTSLNTNCESVLARGAHLVGIQEHSAPIAGQGSTKALAAKGGWMLEMGPCDPEHARPSGGVGLLSKSPTLGIPIEGNTPAYRDAYSTARLAIYTCDVLAKELLIAVVYGWTGAANGNEACERSDDLCHIMHQELLSHPEGPKLVMGDINGDIEQFSVCRLMLREQGWTDLGANVEIWGARLGRGRVRLTQWREGPEGIICWRISSCCRRW